MTARVAALWRHPIKSHGREALKNVSLTEGQTMPWDRRWAVAHDAAKADGSEWAECMNFSRGAKAPSLMAITAISDQGSDMVTLSHPDLGNITFSPDDDPTAFLEWVQPVMPENRPQSARIMRVEGRGMTDTNYPSISLLNSASNDALSQTMPTATSIERWRGNIVMTGLAPWEEKTWAGKTVRIGSVELQIREEITRCLATAANPVTGIRDADTLGALKALGHQKFGVYAVVTRSGEIAVDDIIEVL